MRSKYYIENSKEFIKITQDVKEDIVYFKKDALISMELFPIKEQNVYAVDLLYGAGSVRAKFSKKEDATSFPEEIVNLINS